MSNDLFLVRETQARQSGTSTNREYCVRNKNALGPAISPDAIFEIHPVPGAIAWS